MFIFPMVSSDPPRQCSILTDGSFKLLLTDLTEALVFPRIGQSPSKRTANVLSQSEVPDNTKIKEDPRPNNFLTGDRREVEVENRTPGDREDELEW
jgi:hypothetical protein